MAKRKPFNPHYWTTCRSVLWCGLGSHQVAPGMRVRFLKNGHHTPGSCAECLAKVGVGETKRSAPSDDQPFDARMAAA